MEKVGTFHCGTSNVVLPVPNKTHFPIEFQSQSRLRYYASLLNTVEINSSFYKIPQAVTIEKWANDVPADFRFTFKLWKGVTHVKDLNYALADVNRFMESIHFAGDKKGCLLIQFPSSVKSYCLHKVESLLSHMQMSKSGNSWHLAVEFRDKSWYKQSVYRLLESYGATMVMHDMPTSITPFVEMKSNFIYLRFHGEKGDYRGSYSDEVLREYASYIKNWLIEGKLVFAYFNNTIGEAIHNAAALNKLVNDLVI